MYGEGDTVPAETEEGDLNTNKNDVVNGHKLAHHPDTFHDSTVVETTNRNQREDNLNRISNRAHQLAT